MPRLIAALIRHGDYLQLPDTPSAHQPFPLIASGQAQAIEAANELRHQLENNTWNISSAVDSSRLLRAWQTAQIITDSLTDIFPQVPQITDYDDLAERGLGSAANLSIKQIEQIVSDDPRFDELPAGWKSCSDFRLPLQGAESLLDAGERVAGHLNRQMRSLARMSDADTLKLFVGHGAAFRHAAYHLGILEYEQIAKLSMYHARPVYIEYVSDDEWRHIGGEWKIRQASDHYTD